MTLPKTWRKVLHLGCLRSRRRSGPEQRPLSETLSTSSADRSGSGTYVQSPDLAGGCTSQSGLAIHGRQLRVIDRTLGSAAWLAVVGQNRPSDGQPPVLFLIKINK